MEKLEADQFRLYTKNEIGDYPSRKQPGFARLFPSKYQQDNEMQGEVYERGQIFGDGHVRGFGVVGGAGEGNGWHCRRLRRLIQDRKSVVRGERRDVRVSLGGRRWLKKKKVSHNSRR